MLDVVRRHAGSWMVKGLFWLLVLSFAIWGVGDYVNREQTRPVATVEGNAISPQAFAMAYERNLDSLRERTGGQVDKEMAKRMGARERTLATLINRYLLFHAARDLRLASPPDALRDHIQANPAFQRDSRFDMGLYEAILRKNRLSPAEYEKQLADDLLTAQLEGAVQAVSSPPPWMMAEAYRLEKESRAVALLALDPATLEGAIAAGDAQLETYLTANKERFMTPERVKIRYVVLDSDSVLADVKVSDEEIRQHYEERKDDFVTQESRRVRHILAKSDGSPAGDQAALATLGKAQEALAQGKSFDQAAREFSQDTTAREGGELGTFSRGTMPASFEEAAFSLEKGKVSQPVKTEFGHHLILVEEITPGTVIPLEEAGERVKNQLLPQKLQDAVYDKSVVVEDQLFAGPDLGVIAKDLNLHFKETGFLERTNPLGEGVEKMPLFLQTAFATEKGKTSTLVELPDGRFFALSVVDREVSRARTLAEAREEVARSYRQEEARKQAKARMESLLAELAKGKDWESAAVDGVKEEKPDPFTRTGGEALPQAVRRAAFLLSEKNPLYPQVVESDTGYVVVKLLAVQSPDPAGLDRARDTLRQQLAQGLGEEQFSAYMRGVLNRADVVIDQGVLDQF